MLQWKLHRILEVEFPNLLVAPCNNSRKAPKWIHVARCKAAYFPHHTPLRQPSEERANSAHHEDNEPQTQKITKDMITSASEVNVRKTSNPDPSTIQAATQGSAAKGNSNQTPTKIKTCSKPAHKYYLRSKKSVYGRRSNY